PRLSNREGLRQRLVRLPIQRTNRRRLAPADQVILRAQPLATAEVRRAVGLVQPADEVDAALLQEQDIQPVGLQPIGQEDVTGAEQVPQRAEQADLALPLAGVLADPEVQDGPTSQGDDGSYPGDRKADARLLIVDLRIGFL